MTPAREQYTAAWQNLRRVKQDASASERENDRAERLFLRACCRMDRERAWTLAELRERRGW